MQSAFRTRSFVLLSALIVTGLIIYSLYGSLAFATGAGPYLRVSVDEARARRYGRIFDVRTPMERDRLGYLPHSLPLSLENLEKGIRPDVSLPTSILIYSNNDDRAARAAHILSRMGYSNVQYLQETYASLLPGAAHDE